MKREIELFPYAKTGGVFIGQSKHETREYFFKSFIPKSLPNSLNTIDYFCDSAMQIEYDEKSNVIFIGIANPLVPILDNCSLFSLTYADIVARFGKFDRHVYREPNSVLFLDFGLSFYFNDLHNSSLAEQVSIFQKGYYDSILNLYEKVLLA